MYRYIAYQGDASAHGSLSWRRSGLTYQVTQLENAALFTREPLHDDDRGATMTLTPAGSALLDRVVPGHVQVVHDVLPSFRTSTSRDGSIPKLAPSSTMSAMLA